MRLTAAALALMSAIALVGCSDDPPPSEGAYCGAVGQYLNALNTPVLATAADVETMVGAWQKVADAAPVAVSEEWTAVMDVLRTAVTIDPADTAALQAFADASRSNEPAANRIIEYTYAKCGATIGPVTPVPTTLVPPATAAPTVAPTAAVPAPPTTGG
ncbi:MAG: hypothetical protein RI900_216 [Actinomycetota bacterium]